ncbi:hypothetical protein RB653_001296 [Dictyostelium firmibasis]|uniref:Methylosome subunit pICln n=1 Tax=Dictyostelium firmibasis TaxID=79012 RepID=A0AAN7U850_9MYCE
MVEIKDLLKTEDEEVFFELGNTTIYIGPQSLGEGHIYVTNKNVHWISKNNKTKYTFNFYSIGLNAVFSKTDEFPSSVYCQVDQIITVDGDNKMKEEEEEEEEEEENNDDDDVYTEIRFIPLDETKIHSIYDALCKGALLNPDPEDDEDDFYYGDGDNNDQQLAFDPNDINRFDDAEEEEEEEEEDDEQQ